MPSAIPTGTAAAAVRPRPKASGARGTSAPSASPSASAQSAIAARFASIQARSGAAAQTIDRPDQRAMPAAAASARRAGPERRAARSQARTTARRGQGRAEREGQERPRRAAAAEAVAGVDAAARAARADHPARARDPDDLGRPGRGRARLSAPRGAATIRGALGAVDPRVLHRVDALLRRPASLVIMLALALLGQSAAALADGRDVLADAKDNQRIDGCYERAELNEALDLLPARPAPLRRERRPHP